ncbi:MAG: glycosyl hydrolase BNR repeat-containing protein [Bacteroidetes bacterium]|nr:MAG: glycosyl hydrolase BNR repeat-containing protein [Bacteroidota bacterium]
MKKILLFLPAFALCLEPVSAQKPAETTTKKDPFTDAATYNALTMRSIGPAVTSGRIADLAVNPANKSEWYIAAAAGGVWKTMNAGVTFSPVFDGQGSYSIGCVTIDPNNPHTVWVGTGENNNQRAVGYGDGIYKSEDDGKSWKNVGLKTSEHIGRIVVDPANSDVVYAAAYGPVWSAGGERGIYKTTDGGKTWKQILFVSENTGFNEIHMDPHDHNVLYACAHQRRRQEWTYIGGGPESALYKSTDGGANWNKLTNGLPSANMGRIGLAISPVNGDYLYAIIEAEEGKGVYRSTDRGASWEKRCEYATAGNYYQEIFAHPTELNTLYSMDVWIQVSNDGGKTFRNLGEKHKHVDNHALWIDPANTNHMLSGCDGGLYESFDGAKYWDFKSNLPITQFYRVSVDNSEPFYNVYGGTQDNNTLGGPSRSISATGVINTDWFVTVGGDGFETVVDPKDPNIVYSQWQYGGLIRFDRRTGEYLDIRPQEKAGEEAYRWNWDAPLLMSNHSNTRLYFAANKVFRSDDRGNSWKVISGDLSSGSDRNKWPVMGKVWGMDGVQKNGSTSIYGNITALGESAKNENLVVAGTDDGLIQVTTDGGSTWSRTDKFAGIPERTRVQNVYPSRHNENVIYACLNNHRGGDFKPYLLKSSDKGKTWTSISANLPARGSVYCLAEDHKNANLLFVGTEFGLYFTVDGGKTWTQLSGGLPSAVCVPDMTIQERENDLVIGTFGRGFYILDDYSPLQNLKKEDLDKKAQIFTVKDGLAYIPSTPFGHKGKSFQGESFFVSESPGPGAVITYWLKDDYKTIREKRKEKEKELVKNNKAVPYPSHDSLRIEDREEAPYLLLVISDAEGKTVRSIKQPAKKGMHRVNWNGRHDVTSPVSFYTPDPDNPYESEDQGPLAIPGRYTATLMKVENGVTEKIAEPVSFNFKTLGNSSLPVNQAQLSQFNKDLGEFRRTVLGTSSYLGELKDRMKYIKKAVVNLSPEQAQLVKEIRSIESTIATLEQKFNGDGSVAKREYETLPGLTGLVENIVGNLWLTSAQQTGTYETKLADAKKAFGPVYGEVKALKERVEALEKTLDNNKAPYTPGRFPDYKGN